jgi:hypothetical protein
MVVAAESAILHETVREVRTPVRTFALEEAVGSTPVSIQYQVFSHQADSLDRIVF